MEISIRPIVRKDFRDIQLLARKSWHMTYKEIIPLEVQINYIRRAYHPRMLEKRMMHSLFLVALYKETILGFINLSHRHENGTAELAAIYLEPDLYWKRNRNSTALLNEALAQAADVSQLYVTVERDNLLGIKFYEAKGFEVVNEFTENSASYPLKSVRMVLKQLG